MDALSSGSPGMARGRARTPTSRRAHAQVQPVAAAFAAKRMADLLALGKWHYAMFGCICLLWLSVGMNNASVAWTLREMSASLGLSNGQEGLVVSGFAFGYCVGPAIMGVLLDRLGRRHTLLICSIVPALCQAAHSFIPAALRSGAWSSALSVSSLRAVQACCSGGTTMCSKVYLNELLPSEGRDLLMSIIHTQIQFGGMALTTVAAALAPGSTWQHLHTWLSIPGLLVFLLLLQPSLLPESPEYLAECGQGVRAMAIMRSIAGCKGLDEATLHKLASATSSRKATEGSGELLRPPLRKLVLLLVANQFLSRLGQQGNDAWGMKFLEATGRAEQKPLVSSTKFVCKILGGIFAAFGQTCFGTFPLLVASYMSCAAGTLLYCSALRGSQLALSWGLAYFSEEVANVLGMTTVVQAFPSRLRGRGVSLVSAPNALAGLLAGLLSW